jgi:hypothetical protein
MDGKLSIIYAAKRVFDSYTIQCFLIRYKVGLAIGERLKKHMKR